MITVLAGASLQLQGTVANGNTLDIPAKPLSLSGSGTTGAAGALEALGGAGSLFFWRGDVSLANNATLSVTNTSAGAGTMYLTGGLNINGKTLTKVGSGTLRIQGPQNHSINSNLMIAAGTVLLNSNAGGPANTPNLTVTSTSAGVLDIATTQYLAGINLTGNTSRAILSMGDAGVLVTRALSITGTNAKLDMQTSAMVVDYDFGGVDPMASIRSMIISGRNSGAWNGSGIMSSTLTGGITSSAIGYADNAMMRVPLTVFGSPTSSVAVDRTSVLVKNTYVGDLNLDGMVDDYDVSIMLQYFDNGAASNRFWWQGDVNYDSKVTSADVAALAANYGLGVAGGLAESPMLATLLAEAHVTPEPATLLLLGLGGAAMLIRRRATRRA
jgi:hypothetical protein